MDQFMEDDDSGEEIEMGSDIEELPTGADLFAFFDPFTIPNASDDSNQLSSLNDMSDLAASEPDQTYNFTAEQLTLIADFDSLCFSKKLLDNAGCGDLLTILNKHWQVYVPLCFNVSDNPLKNLIETDSHKILFKPLEVFICNSQNSDKALSELNELEEPPELCGKVFKAGEPSYFCRDCGSDPTCVLCSNCFRRSKHREHKYKMMTSGGGGYCDCGDPEAWKQHPNCDLHKPKEKNENKGIEGSVDDYVSKLPQDLIDRATQLFGFLLDYIFEILSIEKDEQLPFHLKSDPSSDDYVTMLYNDEVHSYEDVTGTLKKVLIIDDKKALEYAAVVDREGRSAIKRGKKADCQKIKEKVEAKMGTSLFKDPLETKVMHHSLVSHQYFAEKLLIWLQKVCDSSKGLKHILCKLGLFVKDDRQCLIEKFMLSDTTFWKSARSIMHQYYISIYFMEPNWKKEFAVLYAKNYKSIWRNYVKNPDDTVSLTDLAVQMFTVISLSKYLLTNYSLMQIIMDTLIEHSKTSKGKLNFSRVRNKSNPEFKRAQFILYDLKYCLTAVPDEWTDELRKNFIQGFKSFVDFLKFMHGMDSLIRQTHTHVEYEPEWETSFNLLIKLARPVSALIDWCSSDRAVYIESFKYLLHTIYQAEINDPQFKYNFEKRKLNDKTYEIIDSAVIKQEISIHAPLTRLFSVIYSRIGKFSLDFNSFFENKLNESQSSISFSALKHDLPKPKVISLMEPSIRSLVLVSQTNAGLWKRNGFSLLSQVYFYSNIKCRHDMFDRDILCLQMGASVIESNEFLTNLLAHYNLLEFYTDVDFDEQKAPNFPEELKQMEYLLPITEDLLELLIYIISERYERELSEIEQVNKIEREVIQQLCISPMPHSDLVKNVYTDTEKMASEQELNSVLNRIAVFKNPRPNSNEKGVYMLKDEYRSKYSPYFYHYIKSEKTKSEEQQLSLKTSINEKFFKPCDLPSFRAPFGNIEKLLQSDIFIQIIITVFQRCLNKSKLYSDGQLAKVLHLMGLALHKEKLDIGKNKSNKTYEFNFLEKSVLDMDSELNLINLLNKVILTITTNQYKLLSMWILEYAQSLKNLKFETISKGVELMQTSEESTELGQESSAKTSESLGADDVGVQKEKRKNLIAEKRRAKILAQLNKQQKSFIQNNKVFFDETKTQIGVETATISNVIEASTHDEIVCIGPNQTVTSINDIQKKSYQCILCQEEEEISLNKKTKPMVLCCYVEHSKVLSKDRSETIEKMNDLNLLFMKNTLSYGIHTNSCGHVMCSPCWQKYVETYRLSENRRHARYLNYNIKEEFMCPLCETVGNSVIPIYPDFRELNCNNRADTKDASRASLSYEDWLDCLEKTLDNSVKKELQDDKDVFIINPCPLSKITRLMADAVAYNFKSLFEFDSFTHLTNLENATTSKIEISEVQQLSSETVTLMQNFNKVTMKKLYNVKFEKLDSLLNHNDIELSKPLCIMVNCAYTIQCIEQYISLESKCLFGEFSIKQSNLLSSIVKQSALSALYPPFKSPNEKLSKSDQENVVRDNCVRLLAAILPYKTVLFESKNIVDIDIFHFLVYLSLSLPNLYQDTTSSPNIKSIANLEVNYYNIFKLCLQAHCVQIVLIKLKKKKHAGEIPDTKPIFDENELKIYHFYQYLLNWFLEKKFLILSDEEKSNLKSSPKVISDMLKKSLMPFLRNSALFFSNLTDLTPVVKITSNPDDLDENFSQLLKFLGLTTDLSDVLTMEKNSLKTLCDFWLSNAQSINSVKIDYPFEVNKLIELPNDYIDLISMSMSSNVCQSKSSTSLMDTETALPTYICLICGEKICGQAYCCVQEIGTKRVGTSCAHARKCGNNVGMFLRVAECQVMLIHLNPTSDGITARGCFLPAPYVDDYGETDQFLKRGNPLKLCFSRYQKLYKDWLSHSIPDVISRRYQTDSAIFHTDWIQL